MQLVARCRKCGRVMKSERIDNYRVKMTCSCGFSDFRTITEKVKTVNPFYHKASFTPFLESEKGKMVLTMQKANREHLEIISLEEISMLVSSDFELAAGPATDGGQDCGPAQGERLFNLSHGRR